MTDIVEKISNKNSEKESASAQVEQEIAAVDLNVLKLPNTVSTEAFEQLKVPEARQEVNKQDQELREQTEKLTELLLLAREARNFEKGWSKKIASETSEHMRSYQEGKYKLAKSELKHKYQRLEELSESLGLSSDLNSSIESARNDGIVEAKLDTLAKTRGLSKEEIIKKASEIEELKGIEENELLSYVARVKLSEYLNYATQKDRIGYRGVINRNIEEGFRHDVRGEEHLVTESETLYKQRQKHQEQRKDQAKKLGEYSEYLDLSQIEKVTESISKSSQLEHWLNVCISKEVPWSKVEEVFDRQKGNELLSKEIVEATYYQKSFNDVASRILRINQEIGFLKTPATHGGHQESMLKIVDLEKELKEKHQRLRDLLVEKPGVIDLDQLKQKESEARKGGYFAYGDAKAKAEEQALKEEQERLSKRTPVQVIEETVGEGLSNLPKVLPSIDYYVNLPIYSLGSGAKAVLSGEDGVKAYKDAGESFLVDHEKQWDELLPGGGLLPDSVEEMANMEAGFWSFGVKNNFIGLAATGTVGTALETLQVSVDEGARGLANEVSGLDLTREQYVDLQQSDPFFKWGNRATATAKLAIGTALCAKTMPGGSSLNALARPLGVSIGMGAAGAVAEQLLDDKDWSTTQFLDDTYQGTSGSMLFMGAMGVVRLGIVKSTYNGPIPATPKEMVTLSVTSPEKFAQFQSAMARAVSVTEAIDFVDGMSDMGEALGSVRQVTDFQKGLGAAIKIAVSGQDVADVNLGMGKGGSKTVDTNINSVKIEIGGEEIIGRYSNDQSTVYFDTQEALDKVFRERSALEISTKNGISLADARVEAENFVASPLSFYDKESSKVFAVVPSADANSSEHIIYQSNLVHELVFSGEKDKIAAFEAQAEFLSRGKNLEGKEQARYQMEFIGDRYQIVEVSNPEQEITRPTRDEIRRFIEISNPSNLVDGVSQEDKILSTKEIIDEIRSSVADNALDKEGYASQEESNPNSFEIRETGETTTTLTRENVSLVELKVASESFRGYFSGNSKVFYLENKEDLPRLHEALVAEGGEANTESEGVMGFYDQGSDTIFVSKPEVGESRGETLVRTSVLAHENVHKISNGISNYNPSLTGIQEEVEAYKRQAEYLAKNGYQLEFREGRLLVRKSESPVVAKETEIREFVDSRYIKEEPVEILKEAPIDNNVNRTLVASVEIEQEKLLEKISELLELYPFQPQVKEQLIDDIKSLSSNPEIAKFITSKNISTLLVHVPMDLPRYISQLRVLNDAQVKSIDRHLNAMVDNLYSRAPHPNGFVSEIDVAMEFFENPKFRLHEISVTESFNGVDIPNIAGAKTDIDLIVSSVNQQGEDTKFYTVEVKASPNALNKILSSAQDANTGNIYPNNQLLRFAKISQILSDKSGLDYQPIVVIANGAKAEEIERLQGKISMLSHREPVLGPIQVIQVRSRNNIKSYRVDTGTEGVPGSGPKSKRFKGDDLKSSVTLELEEDLTEDAIEQENATNTDSIIDLIESGKVYDALDFLRSEESDIDYNQVANSLIENNQITHLTFNLKYFRNLNIDVANQIIEHSGASQISSNISSFDITCHNEIAGALIQKGLGFIVVSNLSQFENLGEELALELAKTRGAEVISNLSSFSNINHDRLARVMIGNFQSFQLANELENLRGLSEDVSRMLEEKGFGKQVKTNSQSFIVSNARETVEVQKPQAINPTTEFQSNSNRADRRSLSFSDAVSLIKRGGSSRIIDTLSSYSVEDQQKIAEYLIDNLQAHQVVSNLRSFQFTKPRVIIDKLSKGIYANDLAKNVRRFSIEDQIYLAKSLIENGSSRALASNIYSFPILDSSVANLLIDKSNGYFISQHLDRFENLNAESGDEVIWTYKGSEKIVENIDRFSSLSEKVAIELIDDGYVNVVFANREKFGTFSNAIALKLIENGKEKVLANNLGQFRGLDKKVYLSLNEQFQAQVSKNKDSFSNFEGIKREIEKEKAEEARRERELEARRRKQEEARRAEQERRQEEAREAEKLKQEIEKIPKFRGDKDFKNAESVKTWDDVWQVLGLDSSAQGNTRKIKTSFARLKEEFNPEKFSTLHPKAQELASGRMKAIIRAHQIAMRQSDFNGRSIRSSVGLEIVDEKDVGQEGGSNDGSFSGGSSLLSQIVDNTSVSLQTEPSTSNTGPRLVKFDEYQDFNIEVDFVEGKVRLSFPDLDDNVEVSARFTEDQLAFLKKNLDISKDRFGPRLSDQRDTLISVIRSAKLEAAFYGQNISPREAADALVNHLKKEKYVADHYNITATQSSSEWLNSIQKLSGALSDEVGRLRPKYIDEGINTARAELINNEIVRRKSEIERSSGSQVLEGIIGGSEQSDIDLDSLLEKEAQRERQQSEPVMLEINSNSRLLYDRDGNSAVYRFRFEKGANGSLQITQISPVSSNVRSLSELIGKLEQASKPGLRQRATWRPSTSNQYPDRSFEDSRESRSVGVKSSREIEYDHLEDIDITSNSKKKEGSLNNSGVTNTLTRERVELTEIEKNGQTFQGYYSGNGKVFYLDNKEDIEKLHTALIAEGGEANTESKGVAGFYDAASDTIYVSKPVEGESRAETIARTSILAHENVHKMLNGKSIHNPSLTSIQEEVEAYRRQSEYLVKNGFELEFGDGRLVLRMSENPRVASDEEIRGFVEGRYLGEEVMMAREVSNVLPKDNKSFHLSSSLDSNMSINGDESLNVNFGSLEDDIIIKNLKQELVECLNQSNLIDTVIYQTNPSKVGTKVVGVEFEKTFASGDFRKTYIVSLELEDGDSIRTVVKITTDNSDERIMHQAISQRARRQAGLRMRGFGTWQLASGHSVEVVEYTPSVELKELWLSKSWSDFDKKQIDEHIMRRVLHFWEGTGTMFTDAHARNLGVRLNDEGKFDGVVFYDTGKLPIKSGVDVSIVGNGRLRFLDKDGNQVKDIFVQKNLDSSISSFISSLSEPMTLWADEPGAPDRIISYGIDQTTISDAVVSHFFNGRGFNSDLKLDNYLSSTSLDVDHHVEINNASGLSTEDVENLEGVLFGQDALRIALSKVEPTSSLINVDMVDISLNQDNSYTVSVYEKKLAKKISFVMNLARDEAGLKKLACDMSMRKLLRTPVNVFGVWGSNNFSLSLKSSVPSRGFTNEDLSNLKFGGDLTNSLVHIWNNSGAGLRGLEIDNLQVVNIPGQPPRAMIKDLSIFFDTNNVNVQPYPNGRVVILGELPFVSNRWNDSLDTLRTTFGEDSEISRFTISEN